MLPTRLIFVEGIIGSGKSTAARFIEAYLEQTQIAVRLVPEGGAGHPVRLANNLPHHFQPWQDATVDEFLEQSWAKWRAFADEMQPLETVSVFDGQLFHGNLTDLLMMDVAPSRLEAYVAEVVHIISALNPIVIYFYQRDVGDSLRATGEQRGDDWIDYQVNWKLESPYGKRRSLTKLDGLIEFYRTYRGICDDILLQLPVPQLRIDNSETNWQAHYQAIIEFLQLPLETGHDGTTKAQLLEQIRVERASIGALATNHPLETLMEPGACGQWSVKDTVAHIAAWNHRILSAVSHSTRGTKIEPLMNKGEDWPTAIERLNAETYERNQGLAWERVLADYSETVDKIIAFIQTCSERDLSPVSTIRLARMSIGDLIRTYACQHSREHRLILEKWLQTDASDELVYKCGET